MTRVLKRTLSVQSGGNVPKSLKMKEKQLTKMMAIIFATFLMTYIPGYLVKQVSETQYGNQNIKVYSRVPNIHVGIIKGWAQNSGLFDRKFNIVRIRLFWRFQCITSGIYMILLYSNRNLVMHFQ